MLDCCRDAAEMYLFDTSFPTATAYLILQQIPPKIDTLLIDFRQSETPSTDDIFTVFSLDCEDGSHRYTSLSTVVSTLPQEEIIDTTINKLRQHVSDKLIVLPDAEPYDSHLCLLKTCRFVVAGFATYFAAKERFVIFEHGVYFTIGFLVPANPQTRKYLLVNYIIFNRIICIIVPSKYHFK
uniref:Uncharacterized protein n=1 Tax=Panagrolaimus davidi TaxID=227884 RepID=A0A914PTQ1_9BILA